MFSQGSHAVFRGHLPSIQPWVLLLEQERAFPHNPFLSGVFRRSGQAARGLYVRIQLPPRILAWFLGGFINGVSGMGAAMVALPIVACVLEMSEAVPATCLVAVTLAVYVAWMYRAHSRVAPIIPMLLGCIPGLIIGVCVLRVFRNLATGRAWGGLDHICGVATLAPCRYGAP